MKPAVVAVVALLAAGLLAAVEVVPSGSAAPSPSPASSPSPRDPAGLNGMGRLRADRIRYDLRARVMVASGNVSLALRDLEIRADRLRVEQGPRVAVAEGTVRVRSRETHLAAPSLRYEFDTELAEAAGGVILEQQGATITAPRVRFDLRAEVTEAGGGVEVVQGEVRLNAPAVRFEARTGEVAADGGIVVSRPGTRLTGRRLRANLSARRADVRDDATLVRAGDPAGGSPDRAAGVAAGDATTVTAGRIVFRWDANEGEAEDHVVVKQRDRTVWADRMTYSEPGNRVVMTGRVVIEQLSGESLVREGLAPSPRGGREQDALTSATRVTCTRLTMTLRERDLELDGPLVVTQKARSASGDRGTYTHATRRMVVLGNVRMREADGQRLRADRVVISLVEETFEAEGNVVTEFVIRSGPTAPGAPRATPTPAP